MKAVVRYKPLWLPLLLMSAVITTGCSSPKPTPIPASTLPTPTIVTTARPSPPPTTVSPTPTTPTIPSPPTIRTFLQTGKSISETNPSEFAAATQAVNDAFRRQFGKDYYLNRQNLIDLYKPQDLYKLELAVNSLANLTNWEYKENYFDCSEMSALTEYALQAAGFDTLIVVSLDPSGNGDPGVTEGHAWCVVVLKTTSGTQLCPIEATAPGCPQIVQKGKRAAYKSKGKLGSQAYDEYITKGWVLYTVYEAFRYIPEDFDWWNSAPINKDWLNRTR